MKSNWRESYLLALIRKSEVSKTEQSETARQRKKMTKM